MEPFVQVINVLLHILMHVGMCLVTLLSTCTLGSGSGSGINTRKNIATRIGDARAMSLYYEAAAVLANPDKTGGSLKSRIYKNKDTKSSPAQLYALISETSKWSPVLKDVIERCGLLAEERKVRTLHATSTTPRTTIDP